LNWRVDNNSPLPSDHKPIYFELELDARPIVKRSLFSYKRTNWSDFNTELVTLISEEQFEEPNCLSALDNFIKKLCTDISTAVDRTVPKSKEVNYKNKWWNKKLDILKKKQVRTARRKRDFIELKPERRIRL